MRCFKLRNVSRARKKRRFYDVGKLVDSREGLLRIGLLIFLSVLLTACNPYTYPGKSPDSISCKLYVTDSGSGTLSIIDLKSSRKYREVWVGSTPHGLGISPDHRRLYVTVESSHLLREIDTRTDEIIRSVRLTGRPHQLAVTADGGSIYVALIDAGRVDIVDSQTFQIIGTLPVGRLPHNCFVPKNGGSVYATSIRDRLVYQIDPHRQTITKKIHFNGEVRPIAVDSKEKRVYAALEGLHGFAIADVDKGRELKQFSQPLPPEKERWGKAYLPTHGLALSPDERQLWVTSFAGRHLLVYSVKNEPILLDTIEVGAGPNWLTFHPNGHFLYAANSGSDTVSIVDVSSRKELSQIKVGPSPKRLVVAQLNLEDCP